MTGITNLILLHCYFSQKRFKSPCIVNRRISPSESLQNIEGILFIMQSLKSTFSKRNYGHTTREVIFQGSSQNLKQVPEHFIEAFNVDAITLTYQLLTSYRKINIASENIN